MKKFGWVENKAAGFSMVELMVVIAVIAILGAVAVPAIINWLPDYRLKRAAKDLHSHLQQAKLQAVRSNGECAVFFNTANNTYQVVGGGANGIYDGNPVPQNDDVILNFTDLSGYGSAIGFGTGNATQTVPGGAVPATVSYGISGVRFNSRGQVRDLGYAYLANSDGAAHAVGTPTLAGAIWQRKWFEGSNNWN